MKKKFCPDYLPAQLVEGKFGWYIKFYQTDPADRKRKRIKKTFDLNRIRCSKERKRVARKIIHRINQILPFGFPYLMDLDFNGIAPQTVRVDNGHCPPIVPNIENPASLGTTPIEDAISFICDLKCRGSRPNSQKDYRSAKNIFGAFLSKHRLEAIPVAQFTPTLAQHYMDYCLVDRNVGNNTYNNYLRTAKIIFKALADREYIKANPFDKIAKKRKTDKKRRAFTPEERRVVAQYIKEQEPRLFLALLLQYYGFIRPVEIRRLKFKFFDLGCCVVSLPGSITKNHKARFVTLPKAIMHHFRNDEFTRWPSNYYVFGPKLRPHPAQTCGRDTMYKLHKKILLELCKIGMVQDIEGLTWYSWKDTGLTDINNMGIPPIAARNQCGHSDLATTMRYYHNGKVNQPFLDLEVSIS